MDEPIEELTGFISLLKDEIIELQHVILELIHSMRDNR